MGEFLFESILWTLALYGFWEIVRICFYTIRSKNMQTKGIYIIVAVKNGEQKIEGVLRSLLYGREEYSKNFLVTDLGSNDETKNVLEKMKQDYANIQILEWEECKEKVESM